ncbi:M42 family peptidase [Ruminococcaceae bacterium OttesenSCG-928-L11]|nr:M42 family peptidase [Ruminococcaceae bacterium OttesenSCG-928-L11]
MQTMLETIRTLTDIPGVSGDEGKVREQIAALIADHVESMQVDALGNLIAFKKGQKRPAKTILFSAHMDEVGFIVTHIGEDGLLRFSAVGGIDSRVVVGKPVEVGDKRLAGVIGTKAIHHQTEKEREEAVSLDKLFIDIGAKDKEEAERHVSPGDRVIFWSRFTEIGEGNILARALDDRAGCGVLVDMIQSDLAYDSWFAFTVQEETGCTGAVTAAYAVAPDVSFVVEATTASDIGGVAADKEVCRFGQGPVISFQDRGTVYDIGLYRLAFEVAKANNIPVQAKQGVAGGNESRSIQVARSGAKTLAVSMPCRYLHSPSNMLRVQDIVDTKELLVKLCEAAGGLNPQTSAPRFPNKGSRSE